MSARLILGRRASLDPRSTSEWRRFIEEINVGRCRVGAAFGDAAHVGCKTADDAEERAGADVGRERGRRAVDGGATDDIIGASGCGAAIRTTIREDF